MHTHAKKVDKDAAILICPKKKTIFGGREREKKTFEGKSVDKARFINKKDPKGKKSCQQQHQFGIQSYQIENKKKK